MLFSAVCWHVHGTFTTSALSHQYMYCKSYTVGLKSNVACSENSSSTPPILLSLSLFLSACLCLSSSVWLCLYVSQSLEFVIETRILAEMKIKNCGKIIYFPWKKIDKYTFVV